MSNEFGPTLIVQAGTPDAAVFILTKPFYILGQSPNAGIVIDNFYVSHRHAEIIVERGRAWIRDLGSKNGTFVNGERVGETGRLLRDADRIELARNQVVLKFYDKGTITQFEGRGLTVDIQSREVLVDGQIVNLSPKEYNVLEYLCRHRGQACSKDEIAVAGWPEYNGGIGGEAPVGDQDLEQLIRRLRRRIEKDPGNPRYIITMKGYGYRLSAF